MGRTAFGDGVAPCVASGPTPGRAARRAKTERLLAEAASTASNQQRSNLLDQVITINIEVAEDIARRYHGRGIPNEDLDQVANLGLVKAAHRFEVDRGHDFLSFAVPTIRGEIRRHFRDVGWTIRPPRAVQELQSKISAAEADLYQELGRSPRPSEIAERLGVDAGDVQDSLAANGCFIPTSLDTSLADADGARTDQMGGPDPAFASAEARIALKSVLTDLSPRERRILEMRFFGDRTQAEIGAEIGVTQMQVSRLLNRLLARLRKRLEDEHRDGAA